MLRKSLALNRLIFSSTPFLFTKNQLIYNNGIKGEMLLNLGQSN